MVGELQQLWAFQVRSAVCMKLVASCCWDRKPGSPEGWEEWRERQAGRGSYRAWRQKAGQLASFLLPYSALIPSPELRLLLTHTLTPFAQTSFLLDFS